MMETLIADADGDLVDGDAIMVKGAGNKEAGELACNTLVPP